MARRLLFCIGKTISKIKVHINAKGSHLDLHVGDQMEETEEEVGDREDDKGECQSPAHSSDVNT